MNAREQLLQSLRGLRHELLNSTPANRERDLRRAADMLSKVEAELEIPSLKDTTLLYALTLLLTSVAPVTAFPGRRWCVGDPHAFDDQIDVLRRLTAFEPVNLETDS